MEAKYQEITLGETLCEKLKIIYFKDIAWVDCYKNVAIKFSELKAGARKFYSSKNEIEVLMELNKYTNGDIVEMME